MGWKSEEKERVFDKIYERYFNQNFGFTSKSDLETLLFSEYIEHHMRNNLPTDDYTLSKKLGITQRRIRSLKELKELKFHYEDFDWKAALAKEIENAHYDEETKQIKMIIQDVNVLSEFRHYIEIHGWYDEFTLNPKLVKIPIQGFFRVLPVIR